MRFGIESFAVPYYVNGIPENRPEKRFRIGSWTFYSDRYISFKMGDLRMWSWLEDGWLGFNIQYRRLKLRTGRYLDPTRKWNRKSYMFNIGLV